MQKHKRDFYICFLRLNTYLFLTHLMSMNLLKYINLLHHMFLVIRSPIQATKREKIISTVFQWRTVSLHFNFKSFYGLIHVYADRFEMKKEYHILTFSHLYTLILRFNINTICGNAYFWRDFIKEYNFSDD